MGNEKMCNKGFEKTVLKGNISYTSYTCSIRKEAWLKVNRQDDVLQFYPFTSCTAILISASKNPRSSLLLLILSLQQN
jgi:hypothetical protein